MHPLTGLIREDMKPALGVTEPGAIAYAAAVARSHTTGAFVCAELELNSGMYKNAYTCGIPNSDLVGNAYAAALGILAGNPEQGLLLLGGITEADNQMARTLVDAGKITVRMSDVSPDITIQARVRSEQDDCTVLIRDKHTNIVKIVLNGETIYTTEDISTSIDHSDTPPLIHQYTLAQILEYISTVPLEEISFVREAYTINLALMEAGLSSPRTSFSKRLVAQNGGQLYSKDARKTAQAVCNTAIEARVIGLAEPAMSITGSGAHGLLCTLPLYAACKVWGLDEEALLRATCLSYLVTMYIKEYSGRLSAFCGCAIAGGTGAACGLAYLQGADADVLADVVTNMASGITGMICDGGNAGCTMKGIVAVDAAFSAAELALAGACVGWVHGINGRTPELTMQHMGRIASPGMIGTERTIVEILQDKENE